MGQMRKNRKRPGGSAKRPMPALTPEQKRKAVFWYLLLLFVCVLPHLAGALLMHLAGDQLVFYFILLYAVIPLTAVIMPFLAALHHAEPLLTFLPAGLMLLFSPVYQAAGLAVALFVLSLIASVAGQEMLKRRSKRQGAKV